MTVKPLTEHHLEFLSLTGGCTGSSESTLVKMPHCWKSHVAAHMPLDNSGVGKRISANVSKSVNKFNWFCLFCLFVLLLYVPSQQLWSLRDSQFT